MADLTTALNESLSQLDELKQTLQGSRNSAGEARRALQVAGQRLETQAQMLPQRIATTQERLSKEADEVEGDSQRLAGQLGATSDWAELRQQQLDKERLRLTQSMEEMKHELRQAHQQLEAQRHEAVAAMETASQTVLKAFQDLAADLNKLADWLNDVLVPGFQREQADVEEHAEKLRIQVLHQILPAILQQYEVLKAHFQHLSQDLTISLVGNAGESAALAHQALVELARALTTLCECNAEEMRGVIKHLQAEENHLRARTDDLFKHARVYAELAEPAVVQLRKLVDVIHFMEELLIQKQVLTPPGGLS